ncbi:MAG: hypothetical protein H0U98_09060 [Alphaproteobacteria bacterium]|nr:hypothetical protein [Alphaproteobacteria bacterium]
MRSAVGAILLAGSVLGAAAQGAKPPVESVTVTAERAREEQIKSFVKARAAPAVRLGKIARWETGICPIAVGLKPEFLKFVVHRVREIAAEVGAPVSKRPSCKPNIDIVFTSAPQALVDNIRSRARVYLGYRDSNREADALAVVNHPIQSWYLTATLDINNEPHIDSRQDFGFTSAAVTGSRLRDGLHSGLNHVIIIADPNELVDHEIGAVSDYVAMLALAEPRSLDICEDLPTILNLLAKDCAGAAAAVQISENDLGYLRGVYHMSNDATLGTQRDEIAYQMRRALDGQ